MLRLANALHSHKARLTAIPVMGRVSGDAPVEIPAAGRRRRGSGAAAVLVTGCPSAAAVRLKSD
ncbi:UNVERIFIED_CONTAM: hypothetical protein Sradi_2777500 [Sesamum radiatum]|uniref:Uncharacterized protein n=1 Tax=Sesamum radiatum TaxID=300843 RepID=A0AAW2SA73_SESRA